jgi:hypothetical protein
MFSSLCPPEVSGLLLGTTQFVLGTIYLTPPPASLLTEEILMPKCTFRNCDQQVVGGFVQAVAAGTMQDPNGTIDGIPTLWCKSHEGELRLSVAGKRGRFLKPGEM